MTIHFIRLHYAGGTTFDQIASPGPATDAFRRRMSRPGFIRSFYPRSVLRAELIERTDTVVGGAEREPE